MSQRIDASRIVFNTNMNSPLRNQPASGYAPAQSRRSGNRHLQPVSQPDIPANHRFINEPRQPQTDRRMYRRRLERPVFQPTIVNQQTFRQTAEDVRTVNEYLENHDFPQFIDKTEPTAAETAFPPVREFAAAKTPLTSVIETADDTYTVDRPVFLLSQKYFGTRF